MNDIKNDISVEKANTLLLDVILSLAFVSEFIIGVFSTSVLVVIVSFFVFIFVLSKPLLVRKYNRLFLWWVLALFVIALCFLRSDRLLTGMFDFIMISEGVFILLAYAKNEKNYIKPLNLLFFWSMFHTCGVLLQVILPPVYSIIMDILPVNNSEFGICGFTSNPGMAAGYICTGILVALSKRKYKKNQKEDLYILLMLVALLFTGKRGPVLFLFMAVIIVYMVCADGESQNKKRIIIFVIAFALFILYVFFKNLLIRIPFVGSIVETVNDAMLGKDVSSARFALWAWALVLFKKSPLLGIGWGMFRTTTAGNATYAAELDVHNIYLQLLCETGIIGFVFVVTALFVFWKETYNAYKYCLSYDDCLTRKWKAPIMFSLLYQSYFLLYGLTGNPLFDFYYQIIYFFSCSITVAFLYGEHKKREKKL